MNENFEKDIAKCLDDSIAALEGKILWSLRKNREDDVDKVGKPLRFLYYDQRRGIIQVRIKFAYTPKEIEFLERVKRLSNEKLQILEDFMAKLLKQK